MRVAVGHVDEYDERTAMFAHQLGLQSVQLHTPSNLVGAEGFWSEPELRALRERIEGDGLRLEGLENVPAAHFALIQRGAPGRDEQIENYQRTVRNMAAAGIPILGHHWMPTYVWRTSMDAPGRGGTHVTSFDLPDAASGNALAAYKLTPDDPVDPPLNADDMWANYQYFLDAVLPVAEEVGVRLSLHPDDPPVAEPLGGAARIFTSPAALAEARDRARGSRAWGLTLCTGSVSAMAGAGNVTEVIDLLAPSGHIAYVHFRDVRGTVPTFTECFLGEGNFHPPSILRRLHKAGFDGFVIDDHVPAMVGDVATWGDTSSDAYCSRGRAHELGYISGIVDALGIGG
jgi:mannonate dehydratase